MREDNRGSEAGASPDEKGSLRLSPDTRISQYQYLYGNP
jgi:hypothetical protein